MAEPSILSVKGVETFYGAIQALHGVDLDVARGEIVTLIGANGAGKSTLLMTICGNPRARGGTIMFDGEDITALPTHQIVRRGVAQVPEGRRIFARMSVYENLQMGAILGDPANFKSDLDRVFAMFPRLAERRDQRGGTLSGGEQQMLAIGRALMTNPKLLILDEATEGLAPLIRQEIWACLGQLKNEGQAILVIDKNVSALIPLADRHHIVEKGRVVWVGSSQALAGDKDLQHRYLGV